MRADATGQATPTANPKVTVRLHCTHEGHVFDDTYYNEGVNSGVSELVVDVTTDEQAWGGQYTILLDNSGETLNAKDYTGGSVDLTWSFVGSTGSKLHPLWVLYQEFLSYEGKLVLELTCCDIWGLIALCKTTVGYSAWNMWWQASAEVLSGSVVLPSGAAIPETLETEMLSCYNQTILYVLNELLGFVFPTDVQLPTGETDSIIDVAHPPITITDILTGMRQLTEMTKSFLIPRRDNTLGAEPEGGTLRVKYPALHASVFSFSTANTFFINTQKRGFVAPNHIHVWAYNAVEVTQSEVVYPPGGTWISNTDVWNEPAYLQIDVPAHYMLASMDTDVRSTVAELTLIAQGILDKVESSVSTGTIIAPMHCSLELFDKVTIVDDRYGTPKTSTGYVYRILREYSRGVYRMTIQIGGQTSGWTPPGGSPATGMAEVEVSSVPFRPDPDWSAILPKAVQGYTHDITFSSTSISNITWSSGTITFYDGTTQAVAAGSAVLPNSDNPCPIQYIIFDLEDASPNVLQMVAASSYAGSYLSEYTSVLCVAQRAQVGDRAVFLPGWDKQPLIVTDMIYMAGLKDFDYGDGTKLHAILSTQIQAGAIKISSSTVYDTNYDPSTKKKVFTTTPTTPYYVGDLWMDASTVKRCTTQRLTGDYTAGDWTATTLDAVVDGSTYKKVLATDISSGHILLSSTVQTSSYRTSTDTEKSTWNGKPDNMDEIGEGSTYQRVKATSISSGNIKLSSVTSWDGKVTVCSGVTIDSAAGINLFGKSNALTTRATETGTIQCSVNSSGQISAGTGVVLLDSDGITIVGEKLFFKSGNTAVGSMGTTDTTHLKLLGNSTLNLAASSYLKAESGGGLDLTASMGMLITFGSSYWFALQGGAGLALPNKSSSPTASKGCLCVISDNLYYCSDGSNWTKIN